MRRLLRFAYLALSLGVVPGDAAWRFNPLEDLETEGKKSGELERDDIEKTWKWTILERLMGPFDIPKVYVLDLYIPLFRNTIPFRKHPGSMGAVAGRRWEFPQIKKGSQQPHDFHWNTLLLQLKVERIRTIVVYSEYSGCWMLGVDLPVCFFGRNFILFQLPPWIVFKVSAAFRWELPEWRNDVYVLDMMSCTLQKWTKGMFLTWNLLLNEVEEFDVRTVWVTSFWWLAAKFLHWEFSNHCCHLSRIPQRGWIWAAAGRNYTNWMNFKRLRWDMDFSRILRADFFQVFL